MAYFGEVVKVSGTAVSQSIARNYDPHADLTPTVSPSAIYGNVRLNGEIVIRAKAISPGFTSTADLAIHKGGRGTAVSPGMTYGDPRLNGEILLVAEVISTSFTYAATKETDQDFQPLTSIGSDGAYAQSDTAFVPMHADGGADDEQTDYSIGQNPFPYIQTAAFGLTGSVSLDPSVSEFEPLTSVGSEGTYAQSETAFEPIRSFAVDVLTPLYGASVKQPSSTLDALGHQVTGEARLEQPSSTLSGRFGAVGRFSGPAHTATLDATFPIIGRARLTQPANSLTASGLTGSIGTAYLTQPRSTLNGRDAWRLSLVQPGAGLVVEATFGGVGHAEVSQPRTVLTAEGGEANYGRARLEQPAGRLSYTGLLIVEQPRTYLAATGGEQVSAPAYVAYAVNLAHFGMTEYTNYGFRQIVEFGGEYYGITDQGLFRLSADTDVGTAIASVIETARPDFGSSQDKRVTYSYMLLDTRDTLDVTPVTGERTGYTQQAKGSGRTGKHNRRVQFGRGMKARNWGLRLEHSGTDRFALEEIEFVGEVLRRKVGG